MVFPLKIFLSFLLTVHFASGASLPQDAGLNFGNLKIVEGLKSSRNAKRSPLEVGFVSFDLDQRYSRHFNIPTAEPLHNVIQNKGIPIVPKSRTISTTSSILKEKGPKADHISVPFGKEHVILPTLKNIHVIDPKILVDHKELLVDHAANVVLHQKHVILEHSPGKTLHLGHSSAAPSAVLLNHPVDSHTVIFEHKPVLVDQRGQETNVLIHSAPKTLVIEHKPLAHPREKDIVVHPKTIVLGTSRTLVLSPKSQIHEIIVHRHVPKTVVVDQAVDEDRNIFRSHFGGFGSGLNYGGHGAGHGFHVPVF